MVLAGATFLIAQVLDLRNLVLTAVDRVNPNNRNRGIASFTDNECWRDLRFRECDLHRLMNALQFLWRLHYPSTLAMMQNTFGIEYSQISRIFNAALRWMDNLHRHKISGNIFWYRSRFNLYNYCISKKISTCYQNRNQGQVPIELQDIFGFIDGTCKEILRPTGNNNAQLPFWNRYYHAHCLIYMGISFPDGMTIIELPNPGYYTDVAAWRDCTFRYQLEDVMDERVNQLQMPRLKLYADKIYNTGPLITAAYSLRHGRVRTWMRRLNDIMKGINFSIHRFKIFFKMTIMSMI
jgi:hypothetical protein